MLLEAPAGFAVHDFFEGVYTHQGWEIFPGHRTKGNRDVANCLNQCGLPRSLEGKRVLDIAPWNGFIGFECVRRGAAELVSLGPDDPDVTGFNKVRELLRIDNCKYVRASVYDLDPAVHGTFDVVLFLGLIYHLRHPLLALDQIYDVASDELYVESPIIDPAIPDRTMSEELKQKFAAGSFIHDMPLLYFTKAAETDDPFNWFIPNNLALRDMVESSGFTIVSAKSMGTRGYIAAKKADRGFTPGVEGYNPVRFRPNN